MTYKYINDMLDYRIFMIKGSIIMRIILHIGNYKTGTSALQNFLFINRQLLEEYGVYYGNTWKIVNNHAGLAFSILKEALTKYGILNFCSDLEELEEDSCVAALKMRFMAKERGANTIIISHEGFFADLLQVLAGLSSSFTRKDIDNVNKYICARLKELFPEAEIVCYLRRQDLYIESMYMEHCKVPWRVWEFPVEFEEFNNKQKLCLDYFNEISRWKKYFGSSVYFKIYERENLLNKDIIYDFLCCYTELTISDIGKLQQIKVSEKNTSLSRDALEHKLLNKINEPLLNYLYKVYSEKYPDNKRYGFMQQSERTTLLEKYKESNKKLFGKINFSHSIAQCNIEYPGLSDSKREEIEQWIKQAVKSKNIKS